MDYLDENGVPVLAKEYKEYINNNINLPLEKLSTSEMDAMLTADNVGKVYIYKGTNGTYTNGNMYIVEEV